MCAEFEECLYFVHVARHSNDVLACHDECPHQHDEGQMSHGTTNCTVIQICMLRGGHNE